jgi:hypothetical protein
MRSRLKKPTHGGARKGAGRPKTKEPTKVMRVPLPLVPLFTELIEEYSKEA